MIEREKDRERKIFAGGDASNTFNGIQLFTESQMSIAFSIVSITDFCFQSDTTASVGRLFMIDDVSATIDESIFDSKAAKERLSL